MHFLTVFRYAYLVYAFVLLFALFRHHRQLTWEISRENVCHHQLLSHQPIAGFCAHLYTIYLEPINYNLSFCWPGWVRASDCI